MIFDFDKLRYFGHATLIDPIEILEDGLIINKDIYGKQHLLSTSYEIFENDTDRGYEYLVNDQFSIGTNNYRKYLVIMAFPIYQCNPTIQMDMIFPENIVGYYDEEAIFYRNELCDLYEENDYLGR